uniref:sphingomyelin phosphodiesterase n=1 Tax=Myotis myotis TaxID=51298 RepID=A0A7J7SDK2_MYOMY|nr:sphingomyelin phosphodiesterase 3 [Myotis myotis]
MVLYTTPFPNSCLSALHAVSWCLIFPCYWLLDQLLALFTPAPCQKNQLLCIVLFMPIYLGFLVTSLPFACLGFLFWCPLQCARRPYVYSRLEDKGPAGGAALLREWKGTGPGKSFCFATANVCLLPESLARHNNVYKTQVRAKEIGHRIRNGASRPQIKIYIDSPTNTSISAASFSSLVSPQGDGMARAVPGSIKRTASVDYKGNSGRHPSDEAANGPASGDPIDCSSLENACEAHCCFKCFNSGLFFASRYPIMDAVYRCYTNGKGVDSLASKGALFLKVQVGSTPQDQRIVGYITCTHLHAPEEDSAIRCEQLDMLLEWLADFRKSTSSSSTANPEELVAFDIVCGDLNFDNCSSDDKLEQQHSLFTRYKDPCRLGPGEEKPWAIGTMLDQDGINDEDVSSPDNLQKVLESEEGRREYLAFPTSKNSGAGQKGRKDVLKGNGRRIDYMLYAEEGLCPDWKAEVEEFSFITQLSGLTDHLPVAMRLMVSTGDEEA